MRGSVSLHFTASRERVLWCAMARGHVIDLVAAAAYIDLFIIIDFRSGVTPTYDSLTLYNYMTEREKRK